MAAEDEIRVKDVTPTIDAFRTGDKMLIDGLSGTANMSKDTLLQLTAQNALAGNVAPEFLPNETNAVAGMPYVYNGLLYFAKVDYNGIWDPSKFSRASFDEIIKDIENGNGENAISQNTKDLCRSVDFFYGIKNKYALYDSTEGTISFVTSSSWTYCVVDAQKLRRVNIFAGRTATNIPAIVWLNSNDDVVGVEFGDIDSSINDIKRLNKNVFAPANAVKAIINRFVAGTEEFQTCEIYFVRDYSEIGIERKSLSATQDGKYFSVADGVVSVSSSSAWKLSILPVENLQRIVTCAGGRRTNIPPMAFFKGEEISTSNFICTYYDSETTEIVEADIEIPVPYGATFVAVNCVKSYETDSYGAYYRITEVEEGTGAVYTIVSKDGRGDFTSINDAVQSVPNDSTIIVMPGVYEENVRAFKKRINIIGVNKKTCILVSYDGRYTNPALEIAAGMVRNMSIMSLYDETKTQLTGEENVRAYAVHVENQQGQSTSVAEGHSLVFENCIFKSDFFPAIGCGGFVDWEFRIENCELTNNQSSEISPPTYTGTLGALYVHSQVGENYGNGNIVVKNNILRCINYANALCMYDLQNANKTLSFTFVGNALVSTAGLTDNIFWRGVTTPFGETLSKNSDCWNNSNSQLNG